MPTPSLGELFGDGIRGDRHVGRLWHMNDLVIKARLGGKQQALDFAELANWIEENIPADVPAADFQKRRRNMDRNLKRRWLEALRSGKYKQGRHAL